MNIFFDADGTLLEIENPYMQIASEIGCYQEFTMVVDLYLSNKISYSDLIERQLKIIKETYTKQHGRNITKQDIQKILNINVTNIKPEAKKIFRKLDNANFNLHVLSSGFDLAVDILTTIGFKKPNIFANELIFNEKDKLVDIKVDVDGDKADKMLQIIEERNLSPKDIVYVGNDLWDKSVIDLVLEIGGSAYLINDQDALFALDKYPDHENFHVISDVSELSSLVDKKKSRLIPTLLNIFSSRK